MLNALLGADLYRIVRSDAHFWNSAVPKVGIGTQEIEIHNPHAGASSTSCSVLFPVYLNSRVSDYTFVVSFPQNNSWW